MKVGDEGVVHFDIVQFDQTEVSPCIHGGGIMMHDLHWHIQSIMCWHWECISGVTPDSAQSEDIFCPEGVEAGLLSPSWT